MDPNSDHLDPEINCNEKYGRYSRRLAGAGAVLLGALLAGVAAAAILFVVVGNVRRGDRLGELGIQRL